MSATPKRPGYYRGRHFTGYVDEVRSLKRAGRLEEAARLLLNLVKATEAESRATGDGVAPWYYEHLAIVYRKQKDPVNEKRLLLRFAEQVHAPGAKPKKLLQRLHAIGVTEAELSRIEARQAANLEAAEELRVAAAKELAESLTDELQAVGLIPTEAEGENEHRIAKAPCSRLRGGRHHLGVRGGRLDHGAELWVNRPRHRA